MASTRSSGPRSIPPLRRWAMGISQKIASRHEISRSLRLDTGSRLLRRQRWFSHPLARCTTLPSKRKANPLPRQKQIRPSARHNSKRDIRQKQGRQIHKNSSLFSDTVVHDPMHWPHHPRPASLPSGVPNLRHHHLYSNNILLLASQTPRRPNSHHHQDENSNSSYPHCRWSSSQRAIPVHTPRLRRSPSTHHEPVSSFLPRQWPISETISSNSK